MQRRMWILVTLVLSLFGVLPAAAQTPTVTPPEFIQQTDPASVIGAYYNAITLGDYPRAYSYWESAPGNRTEAEFAAGFADTASAQVLVQLPIFEDAGAGNVHAAVPIFLLANHLDGTQAYFAGCFTTHKTNVPVGNATEPDPNWHLQTASLKQQTTIDLSVLATACPQPIALTDGLTPPNLLTPVDAVQTYFTAIAAGNMTPVAATGVDNTGNVFARTFARPLTGAQNLQVYVNPQIVVDAAAGSAYATIPVLVTFTAADQTSYAIAACFIARKSNVPVGDAAEPDPDWHITSTSGTSQPDAPTAIRAVAQGCTPYQ